MPRRARWAVRTVVCPACRKDRRVRIFKTLTVSGAPHDVVTCPMRDCELMWLVRAEQPRTAAAA